MIKTLLASFLCISFLSGCTASFLSPAQGMGVEQPKIQFKKTRTSMEASASSDFVGDLKFDGEYDKEGGNFKGKLEAHVASDASSVTEAQVEKIKAMEASYNKYADNMKEISIAQAQAWSSAVQSIASAIPSLGGIVGGGSSPKPGPIAGALDTGLSIWNSLSPEQKAELIAKLGILP